MKPNLDIDELLNSHVDGELTSQQSRELQLLLQDNPELGAKLESVRKVSRLIHTLPRVEVPDDIGNHVRNTLERRIFLANHGTETVARARHRVLQRLKSVAAVVGLIAALSVIVYSIVAPPQGGTDAVSVDNKDPSGLSAAEPVRGRLELHSTAMARIDNLLMRSIQNYGLDPFVEKDTTEGGVSVYVVRCHREGIDLLLSDLRQVWDWPMDRVAFDLNTGQLGSSIRINAASADQVLSVLSEPDLEQRIKLAKLASVQNSKLEMTDSGQVLTAMAAAEEKKSLRLPPKPVLTGGGQATGERLPLRPESDLKGAPVVLTIVLKDE